jgi:hypothetical protein
MDSKSEQRERQGRWRMARARWWTVVKLLLTLATVSMLWALLSSSAMMQDQQGGWVFEVCKYEDLNRNGGWDAGEPGLEDWAFTLQGSGPLAQMGTTNESGCVLFAPVSLPDTYTVCEHLKAGWANSEPGGGDLCQSIALEGPPPIPAGFVPFQFGNYRIRVGGITRPGRDLALLAPWVGLGALILVAGGATFSVWRRRSRSV